MNQKPIRKPTSTAVYAVLYAKARKILAARHAVIVDAVFAKTAERAMIEAVAVELGVSFQGVWLAAPSEQLVNRVANRRGDASDATPEVVRHQLGWYLDPLPGSWKEIDASGTPEMALQNARAAVAVIGAP